MKKIIAFIGHHKVYIDRARAHATYVSMISLLLTMLKVFGVHVKVWHIVLGIPSLLLVFWVIGKIDVALGLFQKENQRHSDLNPFYAEMLERLTRIENHVSDTRKD